MNAADVPAPRIALAARLLVTGLLVCALTLLWRSPLGFVAFAAAGASLCAAGVAVFLWTILVQGVSRREGS